MVPGVIVSLSKGVVGKIPKSWGIDLLFIGRLAASITHSGAQTKHHVQICRQCAVELRKKSRVLH